VIREVALPPAPNYSRAIGLLGDMSNGVSMKDPVQGTARVLLCSDNRGGGVMQTCRMQLVVEGEDVPATAVEHSGIVHHERWPAPGMTLPVTVDRADPRRIKIEWDEIPASEERARESAEELAAAMRGEVGSPGEDATSAGDEMDERLDRLTWLTALRDKGALTDEEFEAQKKRILGD
jgi:hypothetical protein